jgi:hypothetical protein
MPEILSEIQANAGIQFDPQVVRAMQALVEKEGTATILQSASQELQPAELPAEPLEIGALPPKAAKKRPEKRTARRHTIPRFLEPT